MMGSLVKDSDARRNSLSRQKYDVEFTSVDEDEEEELSQFRDDDDDDDGDASEAEIGKEKEENSEVDEDEDDNDVLKDELEDDDNDVLEDDNDVLEDDNDVLEDDSLDFASTTEQYDGVEEQQISATDIPTPDVPLVIETIERSKALSSVPLSVLLSPLECPGCTTEALLAASSCEDLVLNAVSLLLSQNVCACQNSGVDSHRCHRKTALYTCPVYAALSCLHNLAGSYADEIQQFLKSHNVVLSTFSTQHSQSAHSTQTISVTSIWSALGKPKGTSSFSIMSHNLLHEDSNVRVQATSVLYTLLCGDIKTKHASVPLTQLVGIISCLLDDRLTSIRATATVSLCMLASHYNILYGTSTTANTNNANTSNTNTAAAHWFSIPTPVQETVYILLQTFKRAGSSRNAVTLVSKVISLVEGLKNKQSMPWLELGIPYPSIQCRNQLSKDGLLTSELFCFCYHDEKADSFDGNVGHLEYSNTHTVRSKSALHQTRNLAALDFDAILQPKEDVQDTSIAPEEEEPVNKARQARSALFTRPVHENTVPRVASRRFSKQAEIKHSYGLVVEEPTQESTQPVISSPLGNLSALRQRAMQKRLSLTLNKIDPEEQLHSDELSPVPSETLVVAQPLQDAAVGNAAVSSNSSSTATSNPRRSIVYGRRSNTPTLGNASGAPNPAVSTSSRPSVSLGDTLQNSNGIYLSTSQLEPCEDPSNAMSSLFCDGKGAVSTLLNEDWQVRFDSLLELRKQAVFHASLLVPHTRTVVRHLCVESESLRSALSKHALMCIHDFVQNTPLSLFCSSNTLASVLPSLLTVLIKKSTESSEFISSSAVSALQGLVNRLSNSAEINVQVRLLQQFISIYRGNKVSVRMKGAVMEQVAGCIQSMQNNGTLCSFFDFNANSLAGTLALGSTLKERATPLSVYGPLLSLVVGGTSGETPVIRQNAKATLKILETGLGPAFLNICTQHCDAETLSSVKKLVQFSDNGRNSQETRKPALHSMMSVPASSSNSSRGAPEYVRTNSTAVRPSISKQGSRASIGKIDPRHIRLVTPTPPPQPPVQHVPLRSRQRPASRDSIPPTKTDNFDLSALSIQSTKLPLQQPPKNTQQSPPTPTMSAAKQAPINGRRAKPAVTDSRHFFL